MFIANARVPILKFESNYLNISCDVSINNLNGQMKSKLLFWINEIDGRFRNMVLLARSYNKLIDDDAFADISSRASEKGICPYTGQWEQIDTNMRWLPKTYALFVEDPFEQPVNTARTVSIRHLTRISEAFQGTHYALTSRNQNQSSLIPTLVRPHVSQSIWRTPNNPSGYNASYSRPRPQMHRAVHSPSQVLHQFQNMRIDRHPSHVTTQRMVNNASNSQGQRAWRPRSDR
ncbi:Protein HESO1 [Camellia lanceoleosa]|uniref:Protein HESO1 n=1 Tax=Camellia lanceoleosa TaxID=1840588 RepID=A0ACC0J563_9ERIC|nr:Protein HESO1 [Camellia lanceoleosa]